MESVRSPLLPPTTEPSRLSHDTWPLSAPTPPPAPAPMLPPPPAPTLRPAALGGPGSEAVG